MKKLGKIIFLLSLFLISSIGINAYSNYQKQITLDLISDCKISFSGYETLGKMDIEVNIDYDHYNEKQKQFVESISYEVSNDGHLRNGDKVVVEAIYSPKTAQGLGIKISKSSQEVIVKGLIDVYETYEQIPTWDSALFQEVASNYLQEALFNDCGKLLKPLSIALNEQYLIASYYQYDENNLKGEMHFLYRIHVVEDNYFTIDQKIKYYDVVLSDINSLKTYDEAIIKQDLEINELLSKKSVKKDAEAIASLREILDNNIDVITEDQSNLIFKDEHQAKFNLFFSK